MRIYFFNSFVIKSVFFDTTFDAWIMEIDQQIRNLWRFPIF